MFLSTHGAPASWIHFPSTSLASLPERAKKPTKQKIRGGHCGFGSFQLPGFVVSHPLSDYQLLRAARLLPAVGHFTAPDRRNFMNLKNTVRVSLPGGVQPQTHQSQIFLSALIISKDTSHHEEKGIKPGI